MVFDQTDSHHSQWSAILSIAPKIGCTPETLRRWVRQEERDTGRRAGLTTSDRELERTNESLRKASAFFAHAELARTRE